MISTYGLQSSDGSAIYFIGIIDILTNYNTKKKLENLFKSTVHNSKEISCIPPKPYAKRFINYLNSIIV